MMAITDLIAVAAIVMGFGVTVMTFRIQRESEMAKDRETTWIAYSDWLVLFSIFDSLLFVFFPLFFLPNQKIAFSIARAGCFAAIVLEAGYIPSILAHYRLLFGMGKTGPRDNPESGERLLVRGFAALAIISFVYLVWDGLHLYLLRL